MAYNTLAVFYRMRWQFFISSVITTRAGYVCIPAYLCASRCFLAMVYKIVSHSRSRYTIRVLTQSAGIGYYLISFAGSFLRNNSLIPVLTRRLCLRIVFCLIVFTAVAAARAKRKCAKHEYCRKKYTEPNSLFHFLSLPPLEVFSKVFICG